MRLKGIDRTKMMLFVLICCALISQSYGLTIAANCGRIHCAPPKVCVPINCLVPPCPDPTCEDPPITLPPPPNPGTLPGPTPTSCAVVTCVVGTTCQEKNGKAECVPVTTCEHGELYKGIFCGRGPNRQDCPPGYSCKIDPLDRFAVCCPDKPAPTCDGIPCAPPKTCVPLPCLTPPCPEICQDAPTTPTPPPTPAPLPGPNPTSCAVVTCVVGTTCQEKNGKAECVPVTTCEHGELLKGIFCGRGPNRQDCPSGLSCKIDPLDRFAVCCPDEPSKPGKCPVLPPGTVGPCVNLCTVDSNCPGNLKCCSNGCGRTCQNPAGPPKPNCGNIFCPPPKRCLVRDCRPNPCPQPYSCVDPTPTPTPTPTPAPNCGNLFCPPPQQCLVRDCFPNPCPQPYSCVGPLPTPAPTPVKPGQCPVVLPGNVGTCVDQCTDDSSCPFNLKCCSNGCGRTCQQPAVGPNACAAVTCAAGKVCKVINQRALCVPPNCDDITCKNGEVCKLVQVQCITAPCPPIPQCKPKTCDDITCKNGEVCKLVQVQCFTTPCPPVPQCKPKTCADIKCGPYKKCEMKRPYCYRYPCPGPKPVCRDLTCEDRPCRPGHKCSPRSCYGRYCRGPRYTCIRDPCHGRPCRPGYKCIPYQCRGSYCPHRFRCIRDPCYHKRCPKWTKCVYRWGRAYCEFDFSSFMEWLHRFRNLG